MWDRKKIKDKVIESSDRYGFNNPQQISQIATALLRCDPQVVYEGLIAIFKEESDCMGYRQELAGRLLYNISPKASFDLYNEIKACLPYFDASVEHLPFYYVSQCGLTEFMAVLNKIQLNILSEREYESLETIRFWLNNYEDWKKNNP